MINEKKLHLVETDQLPSHEDNFPVLAKQEAMIIPIGPTRDPGAPPKDTPLRKWNMPPEPQGYIKAHDNDCL